MVERAEDTRVELLRIWAVSMDERAEVAALAAAVRLAEVGMGLPSLEPLVPHGVKESIFDGGDDIRFSVGADSIVYLRFGSTMH